MAAKKKKTHITIRLYDSDIEKLEYFADGLGMTISGVIRHVIHRTIEDKKLKSMFR